MTYLFIQVGNEKNSISKGGCQRESDARCPKSPWRYAVPCHGIDGTHGSHRHAFKDNGDEINRDDYYLAKGFNFLKLFNCFITDLTGKKIWHCLFDMP